MLIRWITKLADSVQEEADAFAELSARLRTHVETGDTAPAWAALWEARGLLARGCAIILIPGVWFTVVTVWALHWLLN